MPTISLILFCVAAVLLDAGPALAAQGPGTSSGTAGPAAQWAAVLCGVALPTLGVIFSAWDDGRYTDFSSGV